MLPRLATRMSLTPSPSRSTTSAWQGLGAAPSTSQAGEGAYGRSAMTRPARMSHAKRSKRRSSKRCTRFTLATAGASARGTTREAPPPKRQRQRMGCPRYKRHGQLEWGPLLVVIDDLLHRRRLAVQALHVQVGLSDELICLLDFLLPGGPGKRIRRRISVAFTTVLLNFQRRGDGLGGRGRREWFLLFSGAS